LKAPACGVKKKKLKNFLKPTPWKIVLTIVLFTIASLLWGQFVTATISDTFPLGFPMQFYLAWGPCPAGENCSSFNGLWLTLDILFWFVISAFFVDRIGKRKK